MPSNVRIGLPPKTQDFAKLTLKNQCFCSSLQKEDIEKGSPRPQEVEVGAARGQNLLLLEVREVLPAPFLGPVLLCGPINDVLASSSLPASPDIGIGSYSPLKSPNARVQAIISTEAPVKMFEEKSFESFDFGNISSDPEAFGKLWKMFQERHKIQESSGSENEKGSWEMIVLQGVLLTVLVLISVLWAFCCKKRCFAVESMDSISDSVVALARKLSISSRDLPPSYSKVDLRSVGLTIDDHYNPPPSYDWALEDTLIYCNPPPSPTPGHKRRFSHFSHQSSMSDFSSILSRGNSRSSISDCNTLHPLESRHEFTFAPDLEMGPTPSVMRGDSNMSLPIMTHMIPHSARRKSVKSEGYASSNSSRRVSFADEYFPIKRKRSFIVELDPKVEDELRLKLSLLGKFDSFEPIIDGILSEGEEENTG
ncbi:unnamed protein product [Lepeophtheirus salmonis]|uniref:(salmon louse) hypothetical protein n=1 Tax=Lepeophtheirus salmonis TaxID=72036 RepID=A0A7R8H4W9_LEPSM|nr:unnamed protein product [Lepeophtheirus salmonis]CAF2867940.1 unnamed protein product [Lepeophtheirus salmonis]